jgi:galacturan 1,4-alpha-galacturonidase
MWTMTLIYSSKVLMQDIYINNTNFNNNDYGHNLNTDGADTIYASDITFVRFVIDNGDDNIAFKASESTRGSIMREFFTDVKLSQTAQTS